MVGWWDGGMGGYWIIRMMDMGEYRRDMGGTLSKSGRNKDHICAYCY